MHTHPNRIRADWKHSDDRNGARDYADRNMPESAMVYREFGTELNNTKQYVPINVGKANER